MAPNRVNPSKSKPGKKKGGGKKCSRDDDAAPDGISIVDEIHPIYEVRDNVKGEKSKIWMKFNINK